MRSTVYINGLLKQNLNGTKSSFADDTVFICSAKTWEDTESQAEDTTSITFFCNKNNSPNIQSLAILNDGQLVEIVDNRTYLGIELDKHIKWNKPLYKVVKKLRAILYTFKQLRNILDTVLP